MTARLLQIPEIEREYRDLTRDYENAQTRYREVKAKQMQAEVAQELEKDRKAERFSLGEPANLPERPVSPNRLAHRADRPRRLAGQRRSALPGCAILLDPAVKGPLELARIARVPILTAIPYIETRRERVGNRRRTCDGGVPGRIAGALPCSSASICPAEGLVAANMEKISIALQRILGSESAGATACSDRMHEVACRNRAPGARYPGASSTRVPASSRLRRTCWSVTAWPR